MVGDSPMWTNPVRPRPGTGPHGRLALVRGRGWQPHAVIADVLSRYGIPLLSTVTAVGVPAVLAAARRLEFPVAVKAADANLVHKSDIGGVLLNLADEEAVVAA